MWWAKSWLRKSFKLRLEPSIWIVIFFGAQVSLKIFYQLRIKVYDCPGLVFLSHQPKQNLWMKVNRKFVLGVCGNTRINSLVTSKDSTSIPISNLFLSFPAECEILCVMPCTCISLQTHYTDMNNMNCWSLFWIYDVENQAEVKWTAHLLISFTIWESIAKCLKAFL